MTVNCGTFHGGIAATTPIGSCRTITSAPSTPGRVDSHGNSRAIARNASICIHGAGDCARLLNEIGEPISMLISSAISPSLAAYRPEKLLYDVDPLGGRQPRPRALVERLPRRGDRRVDVRGAALGHPRHDLLGVRRDHLQHGVGGGLGPGAADEQCVAVESHGVPFRVSLVSSARCGRTLTRRHGARSNQSAKPLGSCRPRAPCSKSPQPSAPSAPGPWATACPTWSITPNITRPSTAGSVMS